MRRLLIIEILNMFVIPVFFNILLVMYCPEGYRGREHLERTDEEKAVYVFVDIIAYYEEYLLRFILQAIMIVLFF